AIGIGGSELGPRAVNHALRPASSPLRVHFLAAVDGVTLDRILAQCDPETTLVIMTSKSFKTRETQVNGEAVLEWMKAGGVAGPALARHVVVCSAKPSAAHELGLPGENFYPMWDWVGGRFSVWSAVGLPVILCIGSERFREFLAGAHAMDQHALKAPALRNLPMLLALLSWYNHVEYDMHMHAFLPYDERLRTLVLWLQQLEMESLGKNRQPDGTPVVGVTGQGVWGGHGNESQHSFYQWIREGTCRCSIDICWCARPGHSHQHMHDVLNANARAQADALVTRDFNDVFNALSTLEIDELTPATLGALMAMYEHKTALLGALFHINAFDQPGVEYGKQLCRELEASLREQLQSQPPAPIE
ncbi:MAG: glucose-6-phosphate isomerase, partial [Duodenibacillus sp.]|nr:glucose-6-phosphate isomerase [Duodenibacillus sp.]